MKKENRVLVSINQSNINMAAAGIRGLRAALQTVIDEARALGITLENNDMYELIRGPEKFIKEKITARIEAPVVAGMKMNRAKFLENFELPDVSGFVKACQSYDVALKSNTGKYGSFLMINNGMAEVNQVMQEKYLTKNSIYADGEEEVNLYRSLQAVEKALNSANELIRKEFGGSIIAQDALTAFMRYDERQKMFLLNPDKFKDLAGKRRAKKQNQ